MWRIGAALLFGAAAVQAQNEFGAEDLAGLVTPPLIPLLKNAGTTNLFPMSDCFGFKLEEASIDDIQKALAKGQLTSVQLVLCSTVRAHQTQQYTK
jgi:hypothetical protein